jgi:hypothetical protein
MVCADCDSLINYLLNHDLEKIDHHNEMMKCINTLMFVINHMYNELKNKVFYSKNKNLNELHQNNNLSSEKVASTNRFDSLKDIQNNNRKNDTFFKNDKQKRKF